MGLEMGTNYAVTAPLKRDSLTGVVIKSIGEIAPNSREMKDRSSEQTAYKVLENRKSTKIFSDEKASSSEKTHDI